MTDSEKDLASLISKIAELEERQNITARYAVGVKRQLDEVTEKFYNLQQRFEQQLTFSQGLNDITTSNGVASSETASHELVTDGNTSRMLTKLADVRKRIKKHFSLLKSFGGDIRTEKKILLGLT